jgi:hypothetical protein
MMATELMTCRVPEDPVASIPSLTVVALAPEEAQSNPFGDLTHHGLHDPV